MRRRRVALATGTLASCLPLLVAGPAHADGELGLSADGVHWHDHLSRPLFDPTLRWVPGDVRVARFYVRNESPDAGDLSLDVGTTVRDELLETGWLAVSARAGDGAWTTVRGSDESQLIDGDDLRSGRPVRVDVRVVMGPDAPNGTMVLSTDLDFRVTIVAAAAGVRPGATGNGTGNGQAGSGTGPGASSSTGSGIDLPGTGADVPVWLPPVAFTLLAVGAFLLRRRRPDLRSS